MRFWPLVLTLATLRSYIFIDQLQPQTMCYLGTWIRGSLPRTNMAAQIIEVAPGLDNEALTDVALKTARSSIILAAAAHDGGGEGAIDTEGANDPESISP